MRPSPINRQKGFSVLVVIMIGMTLMAFAIIMMQTGGESKERVFEMRERLQSLFVAKGGQQHALTKIRSLPTQFYDAVAYAIGKNPYYDFTRCLDMDTNPGPMFFTGTVTVTGCPQTGANPPPPVVSRTGQWNLTPQDLRFDGPMATHLNRFIKDIRTSYPENGFQKVVHINSTAHNDLAMGPNWRDPFSGDYILERIFVFGSQGAMSYTTESVMISTRGYVKRDEMISPVTAGASAGAKNLTRVYLRYSTSQAGSGFDEMVDMQVSNQEKFNFGQEFDATLASAKRGEVVTGVYEVRRGDD